MANIINDRRQNLGYNLIINWRKTDKGKIKITEGGIIMLKNPLLGASAIDSLSLGAAC